MAKKNNAYWQRRFVLLEDSLHKKSDELYDFLQIEYTKTQKELEKSIALWYSRFAKNNKIDMAEARKMLNARELKELQWDVKEYIKYAKENAITGEWQKQLENASARRHISRLEALKLQTTQSIEKIYGLQLEKTSELLKDVYKDDYYHSLYEIQKGFNIGFVIPAIDDKKLEKVLHKPWSVSGKTFSDSIWDRKNKLLNTVHTQLTQTVMLGKAPDDAIKNIAKKFGNGNKDKGAIYNAGRLVMTESAYFSSLAQKDCFNDLDVEQFEIVATLDNSTSTICQNLDGHIEKMSNYEIGVTAPPFHPWCRTVTVPYFNDEFNLGQRAARDENGATYYVPSNMKYDEWKNSLIVGNTKGLKELGAKDIIKPEKIAIKVLSKLKASGISDNDYNEFVKLINNNENPEFINLYAKYGDELKSLKLHPNKGQYMGGSITYSYPDFEDVNKFSILTHEYGHFYDHKIPLNKMNFKEMEAVREATSLPLMFGDVASSSDEFLSAIRKDKEHLQNILTPERKNDLMQNNSSAGVQDAIVGLFKNVKLKWGHKDSYYNRRYASVESADKLARTSRKKELQKAYKDLGLDANNQAKVKNICRDYEVASETWANILSAEASGGKALEYIKEYLPNSYQATLEILKGVE